MLITTWFVLWALLWAIYFVLDGFDFGMGTLLPFLAKNEHEKRVMYNAAGPFWDGNEVWLITAGGVTFAAFPLAYAVLFSSLYAPLLILLFALIMRAVSFEFRNKIDTVRWRTLWDTFQFLGNVVPALLLGVAFANLFMGIPIDKDYVYHGNIIALLNPYGLAGGVLFVVFFAMHGALWLAIRAEGDLHDRAVSTAKGLWPFVVALAVLFLTLTAYYTNVYAVYSHTIVLALFPILAVVALLGLRVLLGSNLLIAAFIASSIFIMCVTFFGVFGMYPNIIISSLDPAASISLAAAASSPLTLSIMLGVTLAVIPMVLIYQAWVYWIFSFKIKPEDLDDEHAY